MDKELYSATDWQSVLFDVYLFEGKAHVANPQTLGVILTRTNMWFNPFIPRRILIKREKNYHTHYIGQTSDGRQFFCYDAFVFPNGINTTGDWTKERREYVVLFTFDGDGNILTQKHCYLGTTAETTDLVIKNKLEELINELGTVKYGDIKIKPFRTNIDGHTFGLVSKFITVDLEPGSSISFHWPWNGEYDT